MAVRKLEVYLDFGTATNRSAVSMTPGFRGGTTNSGRWGELLYLRVAKLNHSTSDPHVFGVGFRLETAWWVVRLQLTTNFGAIASNLPG